IAKGNRAGRADSALRAVAVREADFMVRPFREIGHLVPRPQPSDEGVCAWGQSAWPGETTTSRGTRGLPTMRRIRGLWDRCGTAVDQAVGPNPSRVAILKQAEAQSAGPGFPARS